MAVSFYILYSASLDHYYVGHTTEPVEERLRKHLAAHRGWTARAKHWNVLHVEVLPDKAAAYRRELDVKRWKKRDRIEALLSQAR